jgi:pilus assembly protein CpaF
MEDIAGFLAAHPPFDAVDADELARVAAVTETESFPAGKTIFSQGTGPVGYLRVVRAGSVEIIYDGQVLDLLGPGELFGHASMLSGLPTGFEARAAEDTLCYRIPADVISPLLARPDFSRFIARSIIGGHAGGGERVPTADPVQRPVETLIRTLPLVCPADEPIREAAKRMTADRASAILVRSGGTLGIVTDYDLRSRVVAAGVSPDTPVSAIMSAPAYTVTAGSLVGDVLNELFGLGPLEALLRDPDISDILVNRFDQVYIERNGRLEETDIMFKDDRHLLRIIERIVNSVGSRIDESSPMVDARLKDGSRVNAIIPPLALEGPVLSIRRFRTTRLGAQDLVERETLSQPMLDFLHAAVASRLNVIVSGGTGAGKTTLLNVLSTYISDLERVVTIEDAAELLLRQRHVVRLETRPANIEGKGAVRQRDLVVNALRMRPDRIILGEVRGEEALDMLQAMNTGHDGGLTTIHANTSRDALYRLDTMVAMANLNIPEKAVRHQTASAINLVIQITRLSDGTRKVTGITEVTGMEGDMVTMQDIFVFERTGVRRDGKVCGRFRATGIRPKCCDRLAALGIQLPVDMFEHMKAVA